MKKYKVTITQDAKDDLRQALAYIRNKLKYSQAVQSVWSDYRQTHKSLETTAGSLPEPESDILKQRGLKRVNFKRHSYFMLFTIDGDKVVITNIFHFLEDYENKLR